MSQVAQVYDDLADSYDLYSGGVNYPEWADLVRSLVERNITGPARSVLDVAAGTGSLSVLLAQMGYQVTASDISPKMVALAAGKAAEAGVDVTVRTDDMRHLDIDERFDVVLCTDDALNYLLDYEQLRDALASFRRHLRPGGVCVFDLALFPMFAAAAGECEVDVVDDHVFVRHDLVSRAERNGGARFQLTVLRRAADGSWLRHTGVHCQQHFEVPLIRKAIAEAGLVLLEELGPNAERGCLEPGLDESRHARGMFVATLA
jgi:SAM-dependent methyltransferase